MKIAKKVLALVMAVAMVACFAAMASADEPAQIKLEMGEKNALNLYPVTVMASNCVGLKSADLIISYNTDVLKFKTAANGADADQVGQVIDANKNTFNVAFNEETLGAVKYSFYFQDVLLSTADWNAALSMKALLNGATSADINGENFEVAILYFELVEGKDIKDAEITFEGTGDVVINDAKVELVGIEKEEAPAPEAPAPEAPAPEAPAPEAPAPEAPAPEAPAPETPKNPEIVEGPNTGDTGVLAIAAGVVALAGAAFVVSKKRK